MISDLIFVDAFPNSDGHWLISVITSLWSYIIGFLRITPHNLILSFWSLVITFYINVIFDFSFDSWWSLIWSLWFDLWWCFKLLSPGWASMIRSEDFATDCWWSLMILWLLVSEHWRLVSGHHRPQWFYLWFWFWQLLIFDLISDDASNSSIQVEHQAALLHSITQKSKLTLYFRNAGDFIFRGGL